MLKKAASFKKKLPVNDEPVATVATPQKDKKKRPSMFGSLFSKAEQPNKEESPDVPRRESKEDSKNSGVVDRVSKESDLDFSPDTKTPEKSIQFQGRPSRTNKNGGMKRNGSRKSSLLASPDVIAFFQRRVSSTTTKSTNGLASPRSVKEPSFFVGEVRRDGSKAELFPPSTRGSEISQVFQTSYRTGSKASGVMSPLPSGGGGSRYVQSARLPALTIDYEHPGQDLFAAVQEDLHQRRRAETDPLPLFGQYSDDLLPDEPEEGNDAHVPSVRKSFVKPRAGSSNIDRIWEGRRSLQLSVNNKDAASGASSSVHVSAATLDRLVEYVVSSSEFMEASQVSAFLLTYHSYVNAQGLLAALASRYDISTSNNDQVARIRTLYVLQRWIEEHWYDFESDDILLMGVVQFALTRLSTFGEENKTDPCSSLLKKLASVQALAQSKQEKKRMDSFAVEDEERNRQHSLESPQGEIRKHNSIAPRLLKHQSKLLIKLEKTPAPDVPKDFPNVWHSKFEGKPLHIILSNPAITKLEWARQLTLLEHNLFKRIPPTELIAQATKQLAKPPDNVRAMISHFNDVSRFVALSICSFVDSKERIYMFKRWVKIGRECLNLNNYNAVFEIMAGIHSVAVYRLQKTRQSQNTKTKHILRDLEEVTSRKNNYATYRTLLSQKTVPIQPSVPFIGATLTDLSFLDQGHQNVVENEEGDALINFAKHRRVAQVIGTIKKFQDHPYLLDVVPEIGKFLLSELNKTTKINDKELYNMSLICEPVQNSHGQNEFLNTLADDGRHHKTGHRKDDSRVGGFLFKKG